MWFVRRSTYLDIRRQLDFHLTSLMRFKQTHDALRKHSIEQEAALAAAKVELAAAQTSCNMAATAQQGLERAFKASQRNLEAATNAKERCECELGKVAAERDLLLDAARRTNRTIFEVCETLKQFGSVVTPGKEASNAQYGGGGEAYATTDPGQAPSSG